MAAFKRLRPATLLKKRLWHWCFLVNFVKFLGTPFLQNTSGRLLLREGRRLKQIEISIISKLKKEKEKCSHIFLFFTCCAHPFCFRGSLFTNRSYVSLYSYFQYVQTCWIWKTYLNTYVKNKKIMLILKCHPRMKFHRCLSSRNEISSRQNHRQGWFISGRVSSWDEISRVNPLLIWNPQHIIFIWRQALMVYLSYIKQIYNEHLTTF